MHHDSITHNPLILMLFNVIMFIMSFANIEWTLRVIFLLISIAGAATKFYFDHKERKDKKRKSR